MTAGDESCSTIPREFPLRLHGRDALPLAWRPGVLAVLLLATLVPRAWMAWQWDVLWGDTLHYVHASDAMRRGDTHEALAEFGLNLYPVILCGLRQLSPDWETTGKWWSVFMATLTVLPLWGWFRRMFDDRVAAAACGCYAFHGKLIAISPLMIRDPTFIFLAAMMLYFLWRAVGEARLLFFVSAGTALAMAIHTRTEGWVLCVPVVAWTALRMWNARCGRWRVGLGAVLCLACVPGAIAAVNLLWLRDEPHWELLRPGHMQILDQFFSQFSDLWPKSESETKPAPTPHASSQPEDKDPAAEQAPTANKMPSSANNAVVPSIPSAPLSPVNSPVVPPIVPAVAIIPQSYLAAQPHFTSKILNFKWLERFAKALTWPGGGLLLIGLWIGRRTFMRPEHQALAAMNFLLLALIRIRQAQAGLDLRYFLLIAVVALPWMALGCLQIIDWIARPMRLLGMQTSLRNLIVMGVIGALTASLSMIDGPIGAERMMRRQAGLGRWVLNRFGEETALAGNCENNSLTAYYSHCRVIQVFSWNDCLQDPLPAAIAQREANVIVLWRDEMTADDVPAEVAKRIVAAHTYHYLEPSDLPPVAGQAMVFVREP